MDRYVSLREWCEQVGYSRGHARTLIRKGIIPAIQLKPGGAYRIPEREGNLALREHFYQTDISRWRR